MPPRFAYWTILIDGTPTAFRAKEQEELLPTLNQLKKKNKDVTLRWFAQGQLWDSPDAARIARQSAPQYAHEKRSADWRPGGAHKDPRDRFKKKNRPERAWSDKVPPPGGARKPWQDKPRDKADVAQKVVRPAGSEGDRDARRSSSGSRPSGGGWSGKPGAGAGQSDRPWQVKPTGPRSQRTWQNKPAGTGERKPWSGKPSGPPRGDRPWQNKPAGTGPRKPWSDKPSGPRKKRDDEPPDQK